MKGYWLFISIGLFLLIYVGSGIGHFIFHNPDMGLLFYLLTATFLISIIGPLIKGHFHFKKSGENVEKNPKLDKDIS